jgi:uncharacterized RDD family membrane protein YckC
MTVADVGGGGTSVGLPPGVSVGSLGARFIAFLIDRSVPALISGLASIVSVQLPDARTPVLVVGGVLVLAWGLLVWQMFAVRAAGPGMRLMKLQLVGYTDGRPIGWGRFLLRWLVLSLLAATGIGLVLMLVFMVLQPRKQGWHDLAADSVVIKERVLAPGRPAAAANADPAAGPRMAEVPAAARNETAVDAPVPSAAQAQPDYAAQQQSDYPAQSQSDYPAQSQPAYAPEPESGYAPLEAPQPAMATDHPLAESEPTAQQPRPTATAGPPRVPAHDPRPLDQDWEVVLDDGREISVTGLVLLGRNPQPRPGEEDAQLIKVADESRTVSKSHLALGVDGNGMYVMDRNSTNGSSVTTVDGQSRKCPPGDIVPVQPGTVVSFGDHWLEVRRAARDSH